MSEEWETMKREPCLINRHTGTCKDCADRDKCDKDLVALHFEKHAGVKNVNIINSD